MPTPVAAAVRGVLDSAVDQGLGGADWSELVAFAEQQGDVALRWDPSTRRADRRARAEPRRSAVGADRCRQSVPSTSAATRSAEPAAGTPA